MPKKAALTLAAALLTACSQSEGAAAPDKPSGPAVATFGDHTITASQFEKELNGQSPFLRARYQSLDKKKELLDSMVRLDLLADEARKAGFDKDAEVQREFKKAMVQHWMKERFNDKDGMASIPESDLHAYYDAHKDDYQRPDRVRTQMVFFKAAPGDVKVKTEAEKDLKDVEAKLKKNQTSAFADLARSRSDDAASKPRGGDIDFHTHDELAKLYGDALASAAAGLKAPNDVSPVVEGKDGFYLLRLEARQPAFNRTFDQVKTTLQSRLWNERRTQQFETFVKDLREKADVKIDESELAKVDVNHAPDFAGRSASAAPPPPPASTPPGAPRPPPGMVNAMHAQQQPGMARPLNMRPVNSSPMATPVPPAAPANPQSP